MTRACLAGGWNCADYCIAQLPRNPAFAKKSGMALQFLQRFCGETPQLQPLMYLRTGWRSGILLQRGIAILDREAAALPGRFLPELGRSHERPFFCPGLLRPEGVDARSRVSCTRCSRAPAQATKSPGQHPQGKIARARSRGAGLPTRRLRAGRRRGPKVAWRQVRPSPSPAARAGSESLVSCSRALHSGKARG